MTDVVVSERPVGRPTKYDPAYCDGVIAAGRLGFSLTAYAGSIEVDRDSITEWRKRHPDFDRACKIAKAVRAHFLEGGMMERDIPAPAMNARKFALVNCAEEDWRSESTIKHVGGDPATGDKPIQVIDVTGLSPEQLEALAGLKLGGE